MENIVGKGVKNLEDHIVSFEMTNGAKHTYEVDGATTERVNKWLSNPTVSWMKLEKDGESHYLKSDQVVKVEFTPQSVIDKRNQDNLDAINSISF